MKLWFLRGLASGVITTRYPAGNEPSIATLPSPPVYRADLLTSLLGDALIAVCPSRALRREGTTLVYDVGTCTACGRCLAVAGPAARPGGLIELAATERGQLVKRFTFVE